MLDHPSPNSPADDEGEPRRSTPSEGSTLESLARQVAEGGEGVDGARDRLIRELMPTVRYAVASQLPPALRAIVERDDIVQDVLIRVTESLPDFDFRGAVPLRTWLRRAALGRIRDLSRFHNRARRDVQRTRSIEAENDREPGIEVEDRGMSVHEVVARNDELELIMSVIGSLPEPQAEIVRLVRLEQLSYEQAAVVMGVRESTIRYHLGKAEASIARSMRRLA